MRQPVDLHAGGPVRPEERPAQPERVDWSARYPDEIVLHGQERKEVALTFDDGPDDEWTPQVLHALARSGSTKNDTGGPMAEVFCIFHDLKV